MVHKDYFVKLINQSSGSKEFIGFESEQKAKEYVSFVNTNAQLTRAEYKGAI